MKTFIIILCLVALGNVSKAQDTAYVSRDKVTALFFPSPVKVIGTTLPAMEIVQKGNGVLTVKALTGDLKSQAITVEEENTGRLYHIPVEYSYGRAGRRILYTKSIAGTHSITAPANRLAELAEQLATGDRADIVAKKKTGGIKAWANKLSISGKQILIRLDIRNQSNLPFEVDFVRFYIRDNKTVSRMATHEQEIIPLYATLGRHTIITHNKERADVFAFHRFSLAEDEKLEIELYERNGNRHLTLSVKQKHLDDIKIMALPSRQSTSDLIAKTR